MMIAGHNRVAIAWCVALCAMAGGARGQVDEPLLSDLVHLNVVDGTLKVEATGQQVARTVRVKGPEAIWSVTRLPGAARMGPGVQLLRQTEATRDPEDFWTISITARSDGVGITARRGGRSPYDTQFNLAQTPAKGVQVRYLDVPVNRSGSISAADLNDLCLRDPEFVDRCIRPVLRQVSGEDLLLPGAADVYRLFSSIEPDADTTALVRKLLDDLADPSAEKRQAAMKQFDRLGASAMCALLREERSLLHPEAQARSQQLIDRASRRTATPAELSNDVGFLIDCLMFDDERVRVAARERLQVLLGRTVQMPAAPAPADWANTARLLRLERLSRAPAKRPD